MSVADEILARSPSSYWKLNEASGTSFADEVGGITGTAVATPVVNQAPITPGDATGKSVRFDNVDGDAIDFGNVYDFVGTASFTALAYLKPIAYNSGTGHVIWGNTDSAARGWQLVLLNPAVTWTMRRGDDAGFDEVTYAMTQADYEDGSVMQVAMVYNGTNLRLNINGVDVVSAASAKSVVAPTTLTNMRFCAHNGGGSGFDGYADDVAIFSTALSEAQLTTIYNAGFPATASILRPAIVV